LASSPQLALEVHLAPKQTAEFSHDRESKAGARKLPRHRIVARLKNATLAKLLKDFLLFFQPDANPSIDHIQHEFRRGLLNWLLEPRPHIDSTTPRRKFYGVGQ
jgi:hypothetical protein